MPTLEELRKKFVSSDNVFIPTPENQARRLKSAKERSIKEARVAKARAARYNMTLRSLALKSSQKQKQEEKQDRDKVAEVKAKAAKYNATSRALDIKRTHDKKEQEIADLKTVAETKAAASKYNMTKRALPLSVVRKDKDNIEKALGANVAPTLAKEALSAVAANQIEEEAVEVAEEDSLLEVEKDETKKIEMGDLATALESGDDDAVNRSILKTFLETNAPNELPNLEKLLVEYSGRLQELFDDLIEKYPGPHDAEIDGEIKAAKEIAGDVDEDEENVSSPDFEDAESLVADSADADSLIAAEATKRYSEGYKSIILEVEEDPRAAEEIKAVYEETKKNNDDLGRAVSEYGQKRKSRKKAPSISSEDSLVVAPEEPADASAGYIVEVDAVKQEESDKATRWAVQLKQPTVDLHSKLVQQGMNEAQAAKMVEELENSTSEML
mmetsp:Transcript_18161/g.23741  ORF Transcript_18161/g.23741 Transcript_18161/m.23741 type:complete len:442 (-) Transcript_18161:2389-3714(-)